MQGTAFRQHNSQKANKVNKKEKENNKLETHRARVYVMERYWHATQHKQHKKLSNIFLKQPSHYK